MDMASAMSDSDMNDTGIADIIPDAAEIGDIPVTDTEIPDDSSYDIPNELPMEDVPTEDTIGFTEDSVPHASLPEDIKICLGDDNTTLSNIETVEIPNFLKK